MTSSELKEARSTLVSSANEYKVKMTDLSTKFKNVASSLSGTEDTLFSREIMTIIQDTATVAAAKLEAVNGAVSATLARVDTAIAELEEQERQKLEDDSDDDEEEE